MAGLARGRGRWREPFGHGGGGGRRRRGVEERGVGVVGGCGGGGAVVVVKGLELELDVVVERVAAARHDGCGCVQRS